MPLSRIPFFFFWYFYLPCVCCAFIVFIRRQHRHGNALFQLVHSNQLLLLLPSWPYLSSQQIAAQEGGSTFVWTLSAPPLTFHLSVSRDPFIHSFDIFSLCFFYFLFICPFAALRSLPFFSTEESRVTGVCAPTEGEPRAQHSISSRDTLF